MIVRKLYKKYWGFGFKSYLYDVLTPSAYFDSLRLVFENIRPTSKDIILDVGCGTGQAVRFLKPYIIGGVRYIGLDLLKEGLDRTKSKINNLGIKENTFCIQADFSQKIPMKMGSVDFLICHFALYVIYDNNLRKNLMNDFFNLLKPGGMMLTTNPSKNYSPSFIINESIRLDKNNKNIFEYLIKKWMVNPLSKILGLNYIHFQLKNNQWKWFTLEEMISEITQAGFEILSIKEVYGQSGYLVLAKKP